MNPTALRNLTLASAKHLLSQGHISPSHHERIVKKVRKPKAMQPEVSSSASFGALDASAGAGAGHYMPGAVPEEQ